MQLKTTKSLGFGSKHIAWPLQQNITNDLNNNPSLTNWHSWWKIQYLYPYQIEITFWNFIIFWNKKTHDGNLVLIRILNNLGNNLAIMQESFLCYHLFIIFFVHVIISYNDVCTPFKLPSMKLEHTFTSSIAYCSTFNRAWRFKWKTKYHKGTHVKAKGKVIRFNHSFFTYMITLLDKSNEFNNTLT
jgi:hypothetical protein